MKIVKYAFSVIPERKKTENRKMATVFSGWELTNQLMSVYEGSQIRVVCVVIMSRAHMEAKHATIFQKMLSFLLVSMGFKDNIPPLSCSWSFTFSS